MASKTIELKVPLQEQANWCWAATTVAVADYYAGGSAGLAQCDVVNRRLGRGDCCGGGSLPAPCDVQSGLTLPLFEAKHHEMTFANRLDFATIEQEIDEGRPVCARVVWEEGFGQGHFVVIHGVIRDEENNITDVFVDDSAHGPSVHTYEAFRRFYRVPVQNQVGDDIQEGLWTHSYFTRDKEEAAAEEEGEAAA